MNEPAVMEVPKKRSMDVRHDYDGNPCSHRKAHNIYGTQMARATYHE
jgi:alpha-glucosidase